MCGTLSNAFLSQKIRHIHPAHYLSGCASPFIIAVTKAPVVDLPFRKPNWELDIGSVEHRCFKSSECTCLSSTLLRICNS